MIWRSDTRTQFVPFDVHLLYIRESTGPDGITANVIAPGQIETEMTAITDEEQIKRVVSMVPVRRVGQPEDIAYAALYLASEEAGYVTGAILDVNGGILKR